MLLVPFFIYGEGIFWKGDHSDPWIQLGVNIAGLLSIIVWAGFHSCLIFGGLKYFGLLRINPVDEFSGYDIIKHGESAYPKSAWKEAQYNRSSCIQTLPVMANQATKEKKETYEPSNDVKTSTCSAGVDNVESTSKAGVDNIAMVRFE